MNYDVVIIGSGLAGLSAALKVVMEGKKALVLAKGLGNIYSTSGLIDFLGYYPTDTSNIVQEPRKALEKLMGDKTNHPYSLVGEKLINEAVECFLEASSKMGLTYTGSLNSNVLMPSAAGTLTVTNLYPKTCKKSILEADMIQVVGIKELKDFYPQYAANNLKSLLKKDVSSISVPLDLNYLRDFNSYDLARALENKDIRGKFISKLKPCVKAGQLVLLPAILGLEKHQEVLEDIENNLPCSVLEVPTLPPSVMGYRLSEFLKKYLKNKGVPFLIGNEVTGFTKTKNECSEIFITSVNGRKIPIKAKSFIVATGGILGEGLKVYPTTINEAIFNLPVVTAEKLTNKDFFDLKGQPYTYAGVTVNKYLQPFDYQTNKVIFDNVYIAGATLAGYDPFIEKSGNGVALTTGYKAGLMAVQGAGNYE